MALYDGELDAGSFIEQRTPNIGKKGAKYNFDREVDGFSVSESANQFNNNDEFHDFDDARSDESEMAAIAGPVIYKKSQRE